MRRVRRAALRRATPTGDPHRVLSFPTDLSKYVKLSWAGVPLTGPLTLSLITHRVSPPSDPGFDRWMMTLWDNVNSATMWEVEHSGSPGNGEVAEFVFGGGTGVHGNIGVTEDSGPVPGLGSWDKTWQIIFSWNGVGFDAGKIHIRNLTDAPSTWFHIDGHESGSFASDLIPIVEDGTLWVGGNDGGSNADSAQNPYPGLIGNVMAWGVDLWDGGAGVLGTDPLWAKTSDLQAVSPADLLVGMDFNVEDPAAMVDLAGTGTVVCEEITASLDPTGIVEWTFDGVAPTGGGGGGPGTFAKGAADSLSTSDAARGVHVVARAVADSASAVDAARGVHVVARAVADSGAVSDGAGAHVLRSGVAVDAVGAADAAVGRHATARAASDVTSTGDVAAGGGGKQGSAGDAVGGSDGAGAVHLVVRGVSDSAGVSEAVVGSHAVVRGVADVAGGSDSAGGRVPVRFGAAGDAAPVSDAAVGGHSVSRSVGDVASASDSATSMGTGQVGANDSAHAADVVTSSSVTSRAAGDAAGVSDAVAARRAGTRGAADSAGGADAAAVLGARAVGVVDVASVVDSAGMARRWAVFAVDVVAVPVDAAELMLGAHGFAVDVLPPVADGARGYGYRDAPEMEGRLSAVLVSGR